MKVKLTSYAHADNGISLQIIPETDAEDAILRGFWRHGNLNTGHPCGEGVSATGFYIGYKFKEEKEHEQGV